MVGVMGQYTTVTVVFVFQYLERELRIDGQPFPFDLEVNSLRSCDIMISLHLIHASSSSLSPPSPPLLCPLLSLPSTLPSTLLPISPSLSPSLPLSPPPSLSLPLPPSLSPPSLSLPFLSLSSLQRAIMTGCSCDSLLEMTSFHICK